MKILLAFICLTVTYGVYANPYNGEISTIENGVEVKKTYKQILMSTNVTGLSKKAKAVHLRTLAVYKEPSSEAHKKLFISTFPKNFSSFMAIFQPKDFGQLYDGFIYIELLRKLSDEYPELGVEVLLGLAGNACLTADAPNYLRHTLELFRSNHQAIYKSHFTKLSKEKLKNIRKFMSASLHSGGAGICNF